MQKGRIEGSFESEIINIQSSKTYFIVTHKHESAGYWMTYVFGSEIRKHYFGLVKKNWPNVNDRLMWFNRNSKEEAIDLHQKIEGTVQNQSEKDWDLLLPSSLPAEGLSRKAKVLIEEKIKPKSSTLSDENENEKIYVFQSDKKCILKNSFRLYEIEVMSLTAILLGSKSSGWDGGKNLFIDGKFIKLTKPFFLSGHDCQSLVNLFLKQNGGTLDTESNELSELFYFINESSGGGLWISEEM